MPDGRAGPPDQLRGPAMIRRRPVPPATPPAPPKVTDRRAAAPHPDPHPMFKGVCICACERCTDRPAKDVTRCICPDCPPRLCGARAGVRSAGDGIAQVTP